MASICCNAICGIHAYMPGHSSNDDDVRRFNHDVNDAIVIAIVLAETTRKANPLALALPD